MPNFHPGKHDDQRLSLNSLTDDELNDIHQATLEVLQKTGLFIETDEALEVFDDAGAEVDRQNKIVKIPPQLVEDAIGSAPSKILLAGRDPKHDKVLEASRVHFTNFSEGIEVVDPFSGERRAPLKADLANAAKLVDSLDEIDVCEKAVGSSDMPQAVLPLHNAEAMLTHTTKHCCVGPGSGYLLKKLVQMAGVISGGIKKFQERPILSFTTCPVSPLKLINECCEIIIEAARSCSIINILSMAMAGGTSPVTLAGTLVTHNAEVLGGITLNQLVRKGAPVIYGSSTTAMDLKIGSASVGTPECAIISGAVARLARYYALPSYVAGGQSDSKISDCQMGHEKTLTGLIPALAGANLIYGPGMLESGITFDYAQLVLDSEFIRMIKHVINGFAVDPDSLAVDVINSTGRSGDFISQVHTLEHMHDHSRPEFMDRNRMEKWRAAGARDSYQRALEKTRDILQNHQPDPLPEKVLADIRSIITETQDEFDC